MDVKNRIPVREQDAKVRATNFEEVCLGYNDEEAHLEALRCLECKNPMCVKGCPVSINIPGFIHHVKEGDIEAAADVIALSSALRLSVDVSALRRHSARVSAYVVSRVRRSPSVSSSVMWLTGRESMTM